MQAPATTVQDYLDGLPADRREAIEAVRDAVNGKLAPGFEETIQYGMISWIVPDDRYPDTYNGQPLAIASLASQKRHMALYINCVSDADEFRKRWEATGRKLDMGKSCLRFRSLENVALEVIEDEVATTTVDGFIADYERSRA